jgi:hypothetical protein
MKGPLTPARRRALEVLVLNGRARQGAGMYNDRPDDPTVSPAGFAWLLDMGYARRRSLHVIVPTEAGADALGFEQMELPS